MTTGDIEVAEIARRNYGIITCNEALSAGLTPRQIQRRVESGRWESVAVGVYRLAGTPRSWQQHAYAAVRAAGPEAVAGLWTAAAIGGVGSPSDAPHVIIPPGRSPRSRTGIVHRSVVAPEDRCIVSGIACTTLSRTLVDCTRITTPDRIRTLTDDSFHSGGAYVGDVERALLRTDGRAKAGGRALRAALDPWRQPITPESPGETRLLRQLDEWGYPPPELQIPIVAQGKVVARLDMGWSPVKLALEYDGERFHGPERWAHDEARHAMVRSLGWHLLHVDKVDLRPGQRSFREALRRAWLAATLRAAA